MNALNSPMALLPPPTHATTASGSRSARCRICAPGLDADDRLEVPHDVRERFGSGDGAQQVVGVRNVGHPVAHRLVDRVLERPGAGGDRDDLGAQHLHAGHVQRLASGVLLAHVDRALQAQQCRRGRRRHPVLAGSGLGDDPALAHPNGEQRLTEHVVDLVAAGVVEVLALEEDGRATRQLAELVRTRERTGPTHVVDLEIAQLGVERRVGLRLRELGRQLVEGMHEGFGHESAAELAESGHGAILAHVRRYAKRTRLPIPPSPSPQTR